VPGDQGLLDGLYEAVLAQLSQALEGPNRELPTQTRLLGEMPGIGVSDGGFNAATPVGLEQFSRLVDDVPTEDDRFTSSGYRVSEVWGQVVTTAQVAGRGKEATAIRKLFAEAEASFEIAERASVISPTDPPFHAAAPDSIDWTSDPTGWTTLR